ncbi:MAG: hypothetical protein GY720_08225 [bacterium]|nr:hypothetical protein [bacterium]
MLQAVACAKVNLSLRVGTRQEEGLHQLDGIFQSISWVDGLTLHSDSGADGLGPVVGSRLGSDGPDGVIDGWDNLAWRAIDAARTAAGSASFMHLFVDKRLPVAAGLGGGSADAAAALALGGAVFGVEQQRLLEIAAKLGSDVPFCLMGGTARVVGTGARVEPLEPVSGFAMAVVVPPIELATGAVYSKWDELDGPLGPVVAGTDLPPQLRPFEELANDLYPAAVATASALEDWRAELSNRWGRPVLLSGSGPSLFAFFVDQWEAADALDSIPVGSRAASVAVPVPFGWALKRGQGLVETSCPMTPEVGELIQTLADWS